MLVLFQIGAAASTRYPSRSRICGILCGIVVCIMVNIFLSFANVGVCHVNIAYMVNNDDLFSLFHGVIS